LTGWDEDRSAGGSPWLFPGRVPGTHAAAGAITRKLNQHGIPARAARNTALADLAGDLPAVVLADLLGLSISAATNWANHTKRNRTDYIATRTTEARSDAAGAAASSK
jgi:L-alanine-DL-glutamate epimerase-like enolase superfamily enzyme